MQVGRLDSRKTSTQSRYLLHPYFNNAFWLLHTTDTYKSEMPYMVVRFPQALRARDAQRFSKPSGESLLPLPTPAGYQIFHSLCELPVFHPVHSVCNPGNDYQTRGTDWIVGAANLIKTAVNTQQVCFYLSLAAQVQPHSL